MNNLLNCKILIGIPEMAKEKFRFWLASLDSDTVFYG